MSNVVTEVVCVGEYGKGPGAAVKETWKSVECSCTVVEETIGSVDCSTVAS